MRFSLRKKLLLGASFTVLLVGAGAAPAFATSGYGYDGTNPASTPCANDAETLPGYPKDIYSPDGTTEVGTYEIRYSPSCGTNWLRVDNFYPSGTALVRMLFGRDGASGYYLDDETANGDMWTPQVYAPGSTCVDYEIFPVSNDDSYTELGYISPGLPLVSFADGVGYKQC